MIRDKSNFLRISVNDFYFLYIKHGLMSAIKNVYFNLNYNSIWNATGKLVVGNKKLNQNSFKSLWYYVINDFGTEQWVQTRIQFEILQWRVTDTIKYCVMTIIITSKYLYYGYLPITVHAITIIEDI